VLIIEIWKLEEIDQAVWSVSVKLHYNSTHCGVVEYTLSWLFASSLRGFWD